MHSKAILMFCAQALLVQSALSQCTSRAAVDASGIAAPFGWAGPGFGPAFGPYEGFADPWACDGLAAPVAGYASPFTFNGLAGWGGRGFACDGLYPAIASAIEFTPTSGGGLTVTSASAVPPTGLSVISENAYEGIVAIAGEVPFVGTTGMEGVLPTAGAGAVNHACGNGINAMAAETTAFFPGYPGAIAPAAAIAPFAGIAPAAAIAPGFAAPAFGYGAGCGCVL